MRIAILGAGISGVSLYDILNRRYNIQCDIFEKEKNIGGLCRTKVVEGYVYDLSGGHVFNSKYKEVRDYVFELLPEDNWQYSKRLSKIIFDKKLIDYPFEFSLSQLDPEIAAECIEGLYRRNVEEVNNFSDFLSKNFGEGIVKYYLRPYNEKIWKTQLEDMDFDWVDGKMPSPKTKEILIRALSQKTNEEEMVHSHYYYPKKGGIQTLINLMGQSIPNDKIGQGVESLEFRDGKVLVNGNEYDLVVNTMPLPELKKCISGLNEEVASSIDDLKYNSVLSYLYSVERENDFSWAYIPDNSIIPHRVVYQGNFSEENAPVGKSSVTVEITGPDRYSEAEILTNIEDKMGLRNPIAKNYTKYAYVVFDLKRSKNMKVITDFMNSNNVILHGRFAEWTYPNMDNCIKNSMLLAESIVQRTI